MPFQALSTGKKLEDHVRNRFRQWCKESGKTQRQAGEPIEWAQQTVNQYFSGEQQIDLVRAIEWCKVFGYSITDLLSNAPNPKPKDARLQRLADGLSRQPVAMQDALIAMVDALPSRARPGRASRRAGSRP